AARRACRGVMSSSSTGYDAARSTVVIGGLRFGVVRVGAPQGGDAVGGSPSGGDGAAVQQRGDLGVGQSGQVVVGHRLALFGGQRGNRFGQVMVRSVGVILRRPLRCVRDRDRPPR